MQIFFLKHDTWKSFSKIAEQSLDNAEHDNPSASVDDVISQQPNLHSPPDAPKPSATIDVIARERGGQSPHDTMSTQSSIEPFGGGESRDHHALDGDSDHAAVHQNDLPRNRTHSRICTTCIAS